MLPIYDIREALLTACRSHSRVIIEAPTGSGKSTQVPQMLLDAGLCENGRLIVLQPRRIAARLLARRVASERGGDVGAEIGYQVRFENHTSSRTRITYETEGILLRALLGDPSLSKVSTIVFDEFHERHLYSDLMFGLARRLQENARPDLRMVVMSATLDTSAIRPLLEPCVVIESQGRTFPVDIRHIPRPTGRRQPEPWDLAVTQVRQVLDEQSEGHVLVFMPGAYEIRRTIEALRAARVARECELLPLHGQLAPEAQDQAVAPGSRRKIIVATNVAETSLTIEGVSAVVDSGLARVARFDPTRGINTLLIEKISRASADQRAGRAGRERPGLAWRLWPTSEQRSRPAQEEPEVCRVDLAETLLHLRELGITDPATFPWISPPPANRIDHAKRLLQDLGAIGPDGTMTDIGRRLVAFPLHPRMSRMLVAAEHYGCVPSACLVAALLQDRSILVPTRESDVRNRRLDLVDDRDDSDILLMLRAFEWAADHNFRRDDCAPYGIHAAAARAADALYRQLLRTAKAQGLDLYDAQPPPENLYRAILTAFPDQVACRLGGGAGTNCAVVHGRRGTVSDRSVLGKHTLFVAAEIHEIGGRRGQVNVRLDRLTAIQPEWLKQQSPDAYTEGATIDFDAATKRVVGHEQIRYHDLIITSRPCTDIADDDAAELLARKVQDGVLVLKRWDARVEQWLARLALVATHCPELGVPPLVPDDRVALIAQVCHGARAYRDIKNREVWPTIRAWLSREQAAAVEAYAPERITLSNGRTPKVQYGDANGPTIALRIQELYDVQTVPAICMGRVTPVVHILAPNHRPVQVTNDLASFWATGYERAKKDLRGRYPKHEWR